MFKKYMSAASVIGSTTSVQGAGAGSTPSAALHSLRIQPVPMITARELLIKRHYLHSLPGGTKLAFGVFLHNRLMGAITLGAGPFLAYALVDGARPQDCMTLTRLWLSDELPNNSESRITGIILRALRKNTSLKFLIAYSDPMAGHVGTIYQATGWLYTGLSEAMPLYDLGNNMPRHSRSVAHAFGSHSIKYFAQYGINVRLIPQSQKHRYIYFLDPEWRSRLRVPISHYPKKEAANDDH